MHVSEIWRYPVKSMRGERLSEAEVLRSGLNGDRRMVVISQKTGRVVTARTRPQLLGLEAKTEEDGTLTINNLAWDSREAGGLVNEAAGERVELVDLSTSTERFDVLPLLVATDGAIGDLGIDSRRLRPNIIIGGVPGQAEREWPGRFLQVGPVVIYAAQLRMRCVMTTYDPDTLKQDRSVLFRIAKQLQGKTALDCSIETPGHLRVNDPVELRATSGDGAVRATPRSAAVRSPG